MAVVQLQARVFNDGAIKDHGSGVGEQFQQISRTPTCVTNRNYIAYFEIEGDSTESPTIQLERQLNSDSWADVTTSSTVVTANISSGQDDGEATVNTLTGSARTFSAGEFSDDGLTGAVSLATTTHTELAFSFFIDPDDVADGDTVRLRCYDATSGDFTYTETIEITVEKDITLPATVSVGQANTHVESLSHVGPIRDTNGNLYVFSEGAANWAAQGSENGYNTHVWKSEDGGETWRLKARTDTATQGMEDLESFAMTRVAPNTKGEYWIVIGNGSGGDSEYDMWRTSDHATNADTFAVTDAQRFGAGTGPGEHHTSMVEKSDGDLWFTNGELIGGDEVIVYDYQVGGTWQGKATLMSATGSNISGAKSSLGASDRMVVAAMSVDDGEIVARAVADDNTLYPTSGVYTINSLNIPAFEGVVLGVVCYDMENDCHLIVYVANNTVTDVIAANTLKWNGSGYTVGDEIVISPTAADVNYPNGLDGQHAVGGSVAFDPTSQVVHITYGGTDFKLYHNSWIAGLNNTETGQVSQDDFDDFTGTNGDDWDTALWTDDSSGSGIIDIQSNEGRLQYSLGYPRVYSDTIYGEVVDIVFEAHCGATTGDFHVGFMKGTTWDSVIIMRPNDGYYLRIQGDTAPETFKNIAGTEGSLSSFGANPGTSTYWYRVFYDGTYVRAKQWSGVRSQEPSTWGAKSAALDLSGDSFRVFASGRIIGADNHYIDNLEIRTGNEEVLYTSTGVTNRMSYCSSEVFAHVPGNGGKVVFGYVYKLYDVTSGEANEIDRDWLYNEIELASIELVGTPQAGNASNGSDVTLTFDVTPLEDDVVIVIGGNADSEGTGDVGPSTTGYTEESTQFDTPADMHYGVWWKAMGATPDSNVVCQGTGQVDEATAYICYVLRGVDTSVPIDVASVYDTVASTQYPDPPAATPISNNGLAIAWMVWDGAQDLSEFSEGYSHLREAQGVDSSRFAVASAIRVLGTATEEDPGAFALASAGSSNGITTIIRASGEGPDEGGPTPSVVSIDLDFATQIRTRTVT